jgi:acyl carrier protein
MTVAEVVMQELAHVCALTTAEIRCEAMLIELGLDSVQGINFLIALEAHFGIVLPDDAIAAVMTVEDVVRIVEDQLT